MLLPTVESLVTCEHVVVGNSDAATTGTAQLTYWSITKTCSGTEVPSTYSKTFIDIRSQHKQVTDQPTSKLATDQPNNWHTHRRHRTHTSDIRTWLRGLTTGPEMTIPTTSLRRQNQRQAERQAPSADESSHTWSGPFIIDMMSHAALRPQRQHILCIQTNTVPYNWTQSQLLDYNKHSKYCHIVLDRLS